MSEELVRVAGWLRRHPDVVAGPSVRATIAAGQLHVSLATVTGKWDVLRAALIALPHRLRVRPGADAEALVRAAVAAALGEDADGASDSDGLDEQLEPPARVLTLRAQTTFALADGDERERGRGATAARSLDERRAGALLDELLWPAGRSLAADGTARARRARSSASERLPAAPRRPGDRSIDLSVRATVRAAARSGRPLVDELRTQARRPTTTLDVALALDVSGSMRGAETRGVAQALAYSLTRRGHRVALLVFSTAVTEVCGLTRDPRTILAAAAELDPADPTDLALALDHGRELLLRQSTASRSRRLLVVTDAQPTVCGGGQQSGAGLPRRSVARDVGGAPGRPSRVALAGHAVARGAGQPFGAPAARRAAIVAAARCARDGIAVSILCPPAAGAADVDLAFATRLARAGGGSARAYAYAHAPL